MSFGAGNTAASRHFGTYRVAVGKGKSLCGEGEDLRIFHEDVAVI